MAAKLKQALITMLALTLSLIAFTAITLTVRQEFKGFGLFGTDVQLRSIFVADQEVNLKKNKI